MGYNINIKGAIMRIIKSKSYLRDYKKLIKDPKDIQRIDSISILLLNAPNLHEVLLSPYKNVYHIEQKKGNLKEFYTVRINQKVRLIMKPVGEYPYNSIEIVEIEFLNIDNSHYGEG